MKRYPVCGCVQRT